MVKKEILDKRRVGWYVISKSGETYGIRTCCHICSESERRKPSLGHKDVKTAGDKNSVLPQRFGILPVTLEAMLYSKVSYSVIVSVSVVLMEIDKQCSSMRK